jgi:hypothetical protein
MELKDFNRRWRTWVQGPAQNEFSKSQVQMFVTPYPEAFLAAMEQDTWTPTNTIYNDDFLFELEGFLWSWVHWLRKKRK